MGARSETRTFIVEKSTQTTKTGKSNRRTLILTVLLSSGNAPEIPQVIRARLAGLSEVRIASPDTWMLPSHRCDMVPGKEGGSDRLRLTVQFEARDPETEISEVAIASAEREWSEVLRLAGEASEAIAEPHTWEAELTWYRAEPEKELPLGKRADADAVARELVARVGFGGAAAIVETLLDDGARTAAGLPPKPAGIVGAMLHTAETGEGDGGKFRKTMQALSDKTGTTCTLESEGQSVTFAPKPGEVQ